MKPREAVLKIIQEAGCPIAGKEIAAALKKNPGTIRVMLFALKQAGQVKSAGGYGLWELRKTNALTKPKLTLASNAGMEKTNGLHRKKLTVKTNALKPELSEVEKARRVYNIEQNKRNAKNREKVRERNRKWREANREKAKECSRRWRKENPEKSKASQIKYYAKKYNQGA